MNDEEKTGEQLLREVAEMRRMVSRYRDREKEFKRTVEDLRESEKRCRLLLDSSLEAMVTRDLHGRVTYLNPAFTKTFGWSSDELLGRPIPYVPEEYEPETRDMFERLFEGEQVLPCDTKRRTKDGRILDIRLSCRLFRNEQGEPMGCVTTLQDIADRKKFEESVRSKRDELEKGVKEGTSELLKNNRRLMREITERYRAEAALRRSQERYRHLYEESMRAQELYRSLLNSTPDPIVIYDIKGRALYANDSFSRTFGWELSEIMGKRIDYVPESEREATMAAIDLLIRKGIPSSGFETKRYTKDGRILNTRLSGSLYNDHKGDPAGLLVIIRDVTSRKRSEERLKASLKEKEVLLREIFHRVKNNLQVISSLLRLQSRYVPREEYRQLFIDSQNRLQSMAFIHEKLYQSKDLANIDFRGYINGLAAHLFHSLGSNPSRIAFRSEIESVSMGIDTAIPCGLIANELISNSLIHAFPGNRRGEIGISLSTADHCAFELVIWDDGVGLPEDIDPRSARSLGLHLVYTLVEQLRGEITMMRSERTEFRIKFDECRSKARAMN